MRRVAALLLACLLTLPAIADETIRVGVSGLPSSRGDPFARTWLPPLTTHAAIFDPLTMVDDNGIPGPWLATGWRQLSDTLWQFELREDVVFSNGVPFDSAAVVAVIDYLTSEAGASSAAARDQARITAARSLGPHRVQIETDKPNPFLPRELSMLMIVEPGQWQALGPQGFASDPVGTGPFRVVEWQPAKVILEANPTSWRPARASRLEILEMPEPAARLQALLSNQLHIAMSIGAGDTALVERADHDAVMLYDPSVVGIAFNTEKDPRLRDVRVRRAMNYAVNKDAIVQGFFGGRTFAAGQPTPSIAFGYNPDIEPYPYDPDRAQALLAEAGYPEGMPFIIEIYAAGLQHNRDSYQQVAADLRRVGIDVDLRPLSVPAYGRGMFLGEWQGSAFGMGFTAAPSFDALRVFTRHNCAWPAPWHCDPEMEKLIAAARAETDLARREELTRAVMAYHHETAPAIYLFQMVRFHGVHRDLDGFEIELGFPLYDRLKLKP